MKTVLAWWFGGDILPNGDGRPVTVGCRLRVPPPVRLCKVGLHGSRRVVDAIAYGSFRHNVLWRVRHSGTIIEGSDKLVSSVRRHLARLDASPILGPWSRRCALHVIDKWDAPDLVREFLETGKEELRSAARLAAVYAARAPMNSGQEVTRHAARSAVRATYGSSQVGAWSTFWSADRAFNKDAGGAPYGDWLEETCLEALGESRTDPAPEKES